MFSLAIHGGAGTILKTQITLEQEVRYHHDLKLALQAGETLLRQGKSALDAVCEAVKVLEDSPLFNAGKGSVFTYDETHEMDASVMEGKRLEAGAVSGVSGIRNPVLLARKVMEVSDHVMLSGKGAAEFAALHQLKFEPEAYFFDAYRHRQWQDVHAAGTVSLDHRQDKKFGTVGAVACDQNGNLAAATSTGGMTNKRFNRVGDTPIIGSGTYANNRTCAISCTGHGEYFMRYVVAYDISCLMEYRGLSLADACRVVVQDKLAPAGGEGGLVAVDAQGGVALEFNSEGMYRGCVTETAESTTWIYRD